jgi:hypothetical protein
MRWVFIAPVILLAGIVLTGCGSSGATTEREATNVLSFEDVAAPYQTAFDAVNALRPHWLRPRGGRSSLMMTDRIQVYLDENHAGDVSALRGISMIDVATIRFIDGTAAAARWGLDHGAGVISVTTK